MKLNTAGVLFFVLITILFAGQASFAQKTTVYVHEDLTYKEGLELFNKNKYGAAQKKFQEVLDRNQDTRTEIKTDAHFYTALCAVKLFHGDAERRMLAFIREHSVSPKAARGYLALAHYMYQRRKYEEALHYFSEVDVYDLSPEESAEYYFKYGYSYFLEDQYDKASPLFYEIKDKDTPYTPPANYYYAHIAYHNKNYETALQGFKKLEGYPQFAPIVPYYITQIYFLQGRYEQVKSYAPSLLDSASTKRVPEIARIIGEAYYRTGDYENAIPYLELYRDKAFGVTREDQYQLGYAYHKSGDYEDAVDMLKEVVYINDSIAQHAHYLMGDSYIHLKDKKSARNAFYAASRFSFDPKIEEDALFNYAKLSYETAYNPYNEAVIALRKYIDNYPRSSRVDEAYNYLVKVFLTTRNYDGALEAMENIKDKDDRIRLAYQKIAYLKGVQLLNDRLYQRSIEYFDKSLNYPRDKSLATVTKYWKAESYYRLAEKIIDESPDNAEKFFNKALSNYQDFIFSPGAINTPYFVLVNYNIGYTYYQQKNYDDAITWFRRFVNKKNGEEIDKRKINDAYNRIADSYYVQNKHREAIEYYTHAIEIGKRDLDYAMFQKAQALFALGKFQEVVTTLEELLANYNQDKIRHPRYRIRSKFELANAYQRLNQDQKALEYYNDITENHKESIYRKSALLRIGNIYRNMGDEKRAFEVFESVVNTYPGSPEMNDALTSIENICITKGDADCILDILNNVGINLSEAKQDSITFQAAENSKDCDEAVNKYTNYLEKFPNGIFKLHANFYRAECYYKAKQWDEALEGFKYVIDRERSTFTETSLLKAARIHRRKENFERSMELYEKLEQTAEFQANVIEARVEQMRSAFIIQQYERAIDKANKLITTPNVADEYINEARLTIAKSAMEQNNYEKAEEFFMQVQKATKSEMGAEARYYLAYIRFLQKDFEATKKRAFDVINQVPSYEYWMARSFILLADVYMEEGDILQAKYALQGIIDHYDNKELVNVAKEKMARILDQEQLEKQQQEEEKIEDIEIMIEDPASPDTLDQRQRRRQNREEAPEKIKLPKDTIPEPKDD